MNENDKGSLRQQLIQRAQTDEAFRAEFLKDPVSVLQKHGVEVPPGIKIKVLEDTGNTFHIVIPKRQGELSDAELDGVAGGFSDFFFTSSFTSFFTTTTDTTTS